MYIKTYTIEIIVDYECSVLVFVGSDRAEAYLTYDRHYNLLSNKEKIVVKEWTSNHDCKVIKFKPSSEISNE